MDKAVVKEHAYKGNVTPGRLAKVLLRRVKPYVKPKKESVEQATVETVAQTSK